MEGCSAVMTYLTALKWSLQSPSPGRLTGSNRFLLGFQPSESKERRLTALGSNRQGEPYYMVESGSCRDTIINVASSQCATDHIGFSSFTFLALVQLFAARLLAVPPFFP
jgi:hypothetical protein